MASSSAAKVAGRFLYLPENANTPGAPTQFTLVVGALDCMFVMGALSELSNPENWEIDPDINLGGLTVEEFRAGIAEFFEVIMQTMEASRVEL